MLVLSRKTNEAIVIEVPMSSKVRIVITVVRMTGDKVRLGIEAPKEVSVLRSELRPPPSPSDDFESSGSRVPRPDGGNLPTLSIAMELPEPDGDQNAK